MRECVHKLCRIRCKAFWECAGFHREVFIRSSKMFRTAGLDWLIKLQVILAALPALAQRWRSAFEMTILAVRAAGAEDAANAVVEIVILTKLALTKSSTSHKGNGVGWGRIERLPEEDGNSLSSPGSLSASSSFQELRQLLPGKSGLKTKEACDCDFTDLR